MSQKLQAELQAGDIVCVDRAEGLYQHYGVYVGENQVIHYSGEPFNSEEAEIKCSSLAEFLDDAETFRIDNCAGGCYSRSETVERAYAKLGAGKNEYSLVFNNCEHFARWCQTGTKQSKQVVHAFTVLSKAAVVAAVVGVGIAAASAVLNADDEYL